MNHLFLFKCLNAFFFVIIGISLMSFSMDEKMDQGLSDKSKLLYGFINRQAKILEKKYHMRQSGVGIGGMDKVWLMSLSFERYGKPLTDKTARKLIINCVEDFLEAVNKDEGIKPFLRNYPFIAKNLDLAIDNYDTNSNPILDPYLVTVSISEGKIGYFTIEKEGSVPFKTKKYESFEEAVAILEKEKSSKD